jgi:hypothetical protein
MQVSLEYLSTSENHFKTLQVKTHDSLLASIAIKPINKSMLAYRRFKSIDPLGGFQQDKKGGISFITVADNLKELKV